MAPPVRVRGGWSVRVRYGADLRGRFRLPDMSEEEASDRARRLERMARLLSDAGLHPEARVLLSDAASQVSAKRFSETEAKAAQLAAETGKAAPAREPQTFRDVADLWISGELHRRYPDRVSAKTTAGHDRARAAVLCETVGDVPLRRFTVDTAERALRALPSKLMRSTRRQYAQVLGRVLRLAVFPLRVIEHSPLPDRWMPSAGPRRAFTFLYPREDERLLRCTEIDINRRLLYGFLAREGLRISEAITLTWNALDLQMGVIRLDRNKTRRPRAWKIGADVLRALQHWRGLSHRGQGATVFHDTFYLKRAAVEFRKDLKLAHVDRSDLHERTAERNPLRIHDLRATFITLSLAAGRSETWVMDRTGHTTSQMLNNYRRQARHAAELELGWLGPLDEILWLGRKRVRTAKNPAQTQELRGNTYPSRSSKQGPNEAFLATQVKPNVAVGPIVPAASQPPGHDADVEAALAAALRAATAAGEWEAVAALARELGERRRARESAR